MPNAYPSGAGNGSPDAPITFTDAPIDAVSDAIASAMSSLQPGLPVVVAFSGGLDTTVAVPWLRERHGAEVVTVTLDLGQGGVLEEVRDRALAAGAATTETAITLTALVPANCTAFLLNARPSGTGGGGGAIDTKAKLRYITAKDFALAVIGEIVVGRRVNKRPQSGRLDHPDDRLDRSFQEMDLELGHRMRPDATIDHRSDEQDRPVAIEAIAQQRRGGPFPHVFHQHRPAMSGRGVSSLFPPER